MMTHKIPLQKKQRGAALITALSILLVLTVLGVATVSTTVLQERMAGNARDAELAFEAAEYALRQAEAWINGQTNTTAFTNTNGLYGFAGTNPPAWQTETNWTTSGGHIAVTGFMSVPNQPSYMIQLIDTTIDAPEAQSLEPVSHNNQAPPVSGNVRVFQITVRGYGLSANSRVMLQSYFGKSM